MKKMVLCLLLTGAICTSCSGAANHSNQLSKKEKHTKTISLTKDDFLKKIVDYQANPDNWNYLGDKPAIIDFYADWCAPCKMLAPILEELAAEYEGQIYVYKVDTEKEKELTALFGITSIPFLLFIPMDNEPQVARGALPKTALKETINSVLLAL